jgi:hypothetical protein
MHGSVTVNMAAPPDRVWELADAFGLRLYWLVLGWFRGRTNANGMRTTLERIKAVVEAQ